MAQDKAALGASFDEIIKRGRRAQAEELANSMLGSGRRMGTSVRGGGNAGMSLASRVGVNKRTGGSQSRPAGINGQWQHDLHSPHYPKMGRGQLARSSSTSFLDRNSRFVAGVQRGMAMDDQSGNANVRNSRPGVSLNIRGRANPGPFVILGSNFARGTTADDIETAVAPVYESAVGPQGGSIQSVRVVASNPTVIAEIVCWNKTGADEIIGTFNNQIADGKVLYLAYKTGGPSPLHNSPAAEREAPRSAPPTEHPRENPRSEIAPQHNQQASSDGVSMEVDKPSYAKRDEGRLNRDEGRLDRYDERDRDSRYSSSRGDGSNASYQDGRYGFQDSHDRRGPRDDYARGYNGRSTYSDDRYRNYGSRSWRG